jgi:DNA-binding CsgD family transcriptional regulator
VAVDRLSPREWQISNAIAQGKNHKEIAAALAISPVTVRNHIQAIHEKLSVRNAAELIAKSRAHPSCFYVGMGHSVLFRRGPAISAGDLAAQGPGWYTRAASHIRNACGGASPALDAALRIRYAV